jgi:uncharacterized protein (TIGR02246 family)
MPRYARLFEAATDTLHAYYRAIAEGNVEGVMQLWIDEEFASLICKDGMQMHGLPGVREAHQRMFGNGSIVIEPLDIRVYDSLGTVVYAIAEAHHTPGDSVVPKLVHSTYVLVHDRGEWRIAHVHSSMMPDAAAGALAAQMRQGSGPLH